MSKKVKDFNEDDVEVLVGLESVRRKPGMYITSSDSYGLMVILRECTDNVIDEFEAGRATKLYTKLNKDGSIEIHDNGQGMPVGIHKKQKVSTLQVLTGMLHAGGKLGGGDAYNNSRGCFSGDTQIQLAYPIITGSPQTQFTIEDLYLLLKARKVNYVPHIVTVDPETRLSYITPITRVIQTAPTNKKVKITLSSGETICTLDHPFYLEDGVKIQAQHIQKGDRLLSYNLSDVNIHYSRQLATESSLDIEYRNDSDLDPSITYMLEDIINLTITELGRTTDITQKDVLEVASTHGFYDQVDKGFSLIINTIEADEFISCYLNKVPYKNFFSEYGYKDEPKLKSRQNSLYIIDSIRAMPHHNYDLGYSEVLEVSIIETESTPMYDMTIPNTHTYTLANGLVVGNTFGVGIKATNALSDYFRVVTIRDKKYYEIMYKKGKLVQETHQIKPIKRPYKTGTSIFFKPDMTIFDKGSKLEEKTIKQWAETASYFSPGIHITIDCSEIGGDISEYYDEEGLSSWLTLQLEENELTSLDENAPFLEYKGNNFDLCLDFTDGEGNMIDGYCNGLHQQDRGNHVDSVCKLIYNSLSSRALKSQVFDRDSIYEGLCGVINFRIDSPRFTSQTKDKLKDSRFEELCLDEISDAIETYFKKNKNLVSAIINRACNLAKLKADFKADKKAVATLKKVKKSFNKFSTKLVKAHKDVPFDEREVIMVEGDSAGGCGFFSVKIKTTKGDIEFGKLEEDFRNGVKHKGFAYDEVAKEFKEVDLEDVRITKYTDKLVEIECEDGNTYLFTPCHLFLTSNRGWVRADELTSEDDVVELV